MNLPLAPSGIGRVAIDLDGTLATSLWPSPEIGEPIETGINILLSCQDLGYEVVIFTARPWSHEGRIWGWLKGQGLGDAVYDVVCGKVQAELYVDDRSYNPFAVDKDEGFSFPNDGSYERMGAGAATSEAPSTDGVSSKAAGSIPLPCCEGDDWETCGGPCGADDEPDEGWVQRMLKGVWG